MFWQRVPNSPAFDVEASFGSQEHVRWLHGMLQAVLVLNLLDAIFTLWWVQFGLATEANALLRDLTVHSPLAFVLAKLSLVSLGCLVLWNRRQRPLAVAAILGAFLLYSLIFLHHLRFSSVFLLQIFSI